MEKLAEFIRESFALFQKLPMFIHLQTPTLRFSPVVINKQPGNKKILSEYTKLHAYSVKIPETIFTYLLLIKKWNLRYKTIHLLLNKFNRYMTIKLHTNHLLSKH